MVRRRSIVLLAVCAVAASVVVLPAAGAGSEGGPEAGGQDAEMRPQREPINFVSVCRYSHSAPDDPIVHPGRPGASHLHDFVGNTTTDAFSTYESLRAGETTCRIPGDTAAYWTPALYDDGQLVPPHSARVYYRPGRKDPATVQAFPAGLRVVASEQRDVRFACVGGQGDGVGRPQIPTCPAGSGLVVRIGFPDCWDGRNLDSPDHAGHMAYARRGSCPSSHPVPVPRITVNMRYPGSDGGNVVFAPLDKPSQPHADFFNAWDQPTLERLVAHCINGKRHCGARA